MRRKPSHSEIELELGKDYLVGWGDKLNKCRLIQPSPKGFNFLNLETNRCILTQHFYAKGTFDKPDQKASLLERLTTRRNRKRFKRFKRKTFTFTIWTDNLIIKEIE